MKPDMPLIELVEVKKDYPVGEGEFYQALKGIRLRIGKGEMVAIMGPSGSGKSTLMHILGALDMPTSGTYHFAGKDITGYASDDLAQIRNKQIGFVFQSFNLLPRTTVLKNVERPMVYDHVPAAERTRRARKQLELLQINEKADNLANHISGGQIQRVAIARALVMDPNLILADEPTGNLDTVTAREIMGILTKLNHEGHTVVVVTHDPDVAAYAPRKITLVDGEITSDTRKKRR